MTTIVFLFQTLYWGKKSFETKGVMETVRMKQCFYIHEIMVDKRFVTLCLCIKRFTKRETTELKTKH